MKADALSLSGLRPVLGRTWLIMSFAVAYLISQVTILIILAPLGHDMARLQILAGACVVVITALLVKPEKGDATSQ